MDSERNKYKEISIVSKGNDFDAYLDFLSKLIKLTRDRDGDHEEFYAPEKEEKDSENQNESKIF